MKGARLRTSPAISVLLAVLLGLWLAVFFASGQVQQGPNGRGLGGDFAIFVSGARVMQTGANPYDRHQLYTVERAMLRSQHLAVPADQAFIRVGNPPLLFWLLGPLTRLPFVMAAWIWVLSMYALCLLAGAAALRHFGRRELVHVVVFAAMPQTVLAAYYGNVDGIVLAAIALSLVCVRRYPYAAGLVLPVALLKPQVALPLGALVLLFHADKWKRCLAGILTSLAGLAALSVLTTGASQSIHWAHALVGYSHEIGVQPDIVSLAGLYVYTAGQMTRTLIQAAIITLALGVTATAWWKLRGVPRPVAFLVVSPLWVLWFLATPFAHFHDEVMLVFPVLALICAPQQYISRIPPHTVVYLLLISVVLFPGNRMSTDYQCISLLALLGLLVLPALRQFGAERLAIVGVSHCSRRSPAVSGAIRRSA